MTTGTITDVPNQPKTPQRSIRIPDDEWAAAREAAEREGTTVSDVVRAALRRYVNASRRRHEREKGT